MPKTEKREPKGTWTEVEVFESDYAGRFTIEHNDVNPQAKVRILWVDAFGRKAVYGPSVHPSDAGTPAKAATAPTK